MLTIGLIGAGLMGQAHARAYAHLPQARLVAVADVSTQAADEVAARHGARAFDTLDELLAHAGTRVDVIDICLPTPLHATHIVTALAAGKHVICEKPIARTLDEGQQIAAAVRAARTKFTVGHVVRFFPDYARAHDLIAAGEIGEPRVIHTLRNVAYPRREAGNWMGDLEKSGGVALDVAYHDFDWLRWCCGEVERVFARGLAYSHLAAGEQLDHALIVARLANRALAHLEVSWCLPAGAPFTTKVEVAGTGGIMTFDNHTSLPVHAYWRGDGQAIAAAESPLAVTPQQAQLGHFLDCILEDRPPAVSVEDALKALELSLAALTSIETGRPVTLGGVA